MDVIEQAVEETIDSFTSKNEVFTALDVSNAVKRNGVACRHSEVRDHVRRFFRSGRMAGYTRDSILVTLSDNSTDQAMLYYPDNTDPNDLPNLYDASRRAQRAERSPGIVVTGVKLLTKPKMLKTFLATKVKQLVAPVKDDDSDDSSV